MAAPRPFTADSERLPHIREFSASSTATRTSVRIPEDSELPDFLQDRSQLASAAKRKSRAGSAFPRPASSHYNRIRGHDNPALAYQVLARPEEVSKMFVSQEQGQLFQFHDDAKKKYSRTLPTAGQPHQSESDTPFYRAQKLDGQRPEFLARLMQYTAEEMFSLGLHGTKPGAEGRLSVFREVFDIFIDEFRSYKSLLSEIKNEYETVIHLQRAANLELEPYKKRLYFCKYETAQELDAMREEVHAAKAKASEEVEQVRKVIGERETQIRKLQVRVEALEREVADKEEILDQLQIKEARLLEVETKNHTLEAELYKESQKNRTAVMELQQALDMTKRELGQKKEECAGILANSVAKSVYTETNTKFRAVKEELYEAKKETDAMRAECQKLEMEASGQRQTIARLEALGGLGQGAASGIDWNIVAKITLSKPTEADPLQMAVVTPILDDINTMLPKLKRPNAKGAPAILPNVEIINERKSFLLSSYKERARMVRKPEDFIHSLFRDCLSGAIREEFYQKWINDLLQHMSDYKQEQVVITKKKKAGKSGGTGGASGASNGGNGGGAGSGKGKAGADVAPEYPRMIVALGLGSQVPAPLRFTGSVRGRMIGRSTLISITSDIWKEKLKADISSPQKIKLSDMLLSVLQRRFAYNDIRTEWAYNIIESCKWFRNDSVDCQLFLDIFTETRPESLYLDLRKTMHRLQNWFEKVASTYSTHTGENEFNSAHGDDFVVPAVMKKSLVVAEMMREDFTPILYPSIEIAISTGQVVEVDGKERAWLVDKLREALNKEQKGEYLQYRTLFESESDSRFLEIYKRHMFLQLLPKEENKDAAAANAEKE